MKHINIDGGCRPNLSDNRDVVLGDIIYTPDQNCPTYEQGFSNEKKYGRLIRDHQGISLSCVGQAWSKYLEMLNLIETKKVLDLSAKDIYSQIFLKDGGAYIRAGAKIVVKPGCCEEQFISSYPKKTRFNTGNPDEVFMREKKQTLESKKNALIFKAKTFVYLPIGRKMELKNWEDVRQIIWQFNGFVSGYSRHCVYFEGYGIDPTTGLRYISYVNSYGKDFGEDGIGKWFERDGKLYDITFLIDQPNIYPKTKMKKVLLHQNEQYVLNGDTIHHIPDLPTRDLLLGFNWIVSEIEEAQNIEHYQIGESIPSVEVMRKFKEFKPILDDALEIKNKESNFSTGFMFGKLYAFILRVLKGR